METKQERLSALLVTGFLLSRNREALRLFCELLPPEDEAMLIELGEELAGMILEVSSWLQPQMGIRNRNTQNVPFDISRSSVLELPQFVV